MFISCHFPLRLLCYYTSFGRIWGLFLQTLSLPNAETIGLPNAGGGFRNCASLESISLPKAVTVGDNAFRDCSSLQSVSLPNAVTFNTGAFSYCTSLESISLPAAKSLGAGYGVVSGIFEGCTALKTVSLPVAETIVGRAFKDCTSLATVSAPLAAGFGESAFWGCTALTSVTLTNAKKIGEAAFYNCSALTSISLPEAEEIGKDAAYHYRTTNMYFEWNHEERILHPEYGCIGAFEGCDKLASLYAPKAKIIGTEAFIGTALTELSLPSARTIGGGAFAYTPLTKIDLPEVWHISGGFYTREEIVYNGPLYTIEFPGAFECEFLTDVSLPKLEEMGASVFRSCTSLVRIELPELTWIPHEAAFDGCLNLEEASFPKLPKIECLFGTYNGNGQLGRGGCPKLRSVSAPNAESIESLAFSWSHLQSLKHVSFPKVKTIDYEAFYGCTALESADFPACETIYGPMVVEGYVAAPFIQGAFQNCIRLESINLPSLKELQDQAFRDCTALASVTFGQSAPLVNVSFGTHNGYPPFFFSSSTAGNPPIEIRVPQGASGYDQAWIDSLRYYSTTEITVVEG